MCRQLSAVYSSESVKPSARVDIAQVSNVRVLVTELAVLILHLCHQDRTTAANLQRQNFLRQPRDPALSRTHERGIVGTDCLGRLGIGQQPRRQPTKVPLRAGVRAGAQDDVETLFLRGLDESGNVILAGEVILAWLRLVNVPEYVGGNGVQAHRLRHLQTRASTPAGCVDNAFRPRGL